MKLDDIGVSDQVCLMAMGRRGLVILGDTTINKGFECFQVFTREGKLYYISLVDEQIEDDQGITDKVMTRINKAVDAIGGRKAIIEAIQEKYNEKIFNTRVPEPEYRDELGKGNIIEYCNY